MLDTFVNLSDRRRVARPSFRLLLKEGIANHIEAVLIDPPFIPCPDRGFA